MKLKKGVRVVLMGFALTFSNYLTTRIELINVIF